MRMASISGYDVCDLSHSYKPQRPALAGSDQNGAFECTITGDASHGTVMRQMVPLKPIAWGKSCYNRPQCTGVCLSGLPALKPCAELETPPHCVQAVIFARTALLAPGICLTCRSASTPA